MRLNRGTLILLVVSAIVIIGVVIFTNNQASQPQAVTPTPEGGGPLYTDLTADQVLSLAVRDNTAGSYTRLSRADAESAWEVTGSADLTDQVVDQDQANQVINSAISLESLSNFTGENLADFGLDQPSYTIEIDTGAETLNVILVGNRNPAGNRYYVLLQHMDTSIIESTEEPQASAGTIYLISTTALTPLTGLTTKPPFQPTATPPPTATATLNPMSEVEMATATAGAQATMNSLMGTAMAEATAAAEATLEATVEATAEATAEAGS